MRADSRCDRPQVKALSGLTIRCEVQGCGQPAGFSSAPVAVPYRLFVNPTPASRLCAKAYLYPNPAKRSCAPVGSLPDRSFLIRVQARLSGAVCPEGGRIVASAQIQIPAGAGAPFDSGPAARQPSSRCRGLPVGWRAWRPRQNPISPPGSTKEGAAAGRIRFRTSRGTSAAAARAAFPARRKCDA